MLWIVNCEYMYVFVYGRFPFGLNSNKWNHLKSLSFNPKNHLTFQIHTRYNVTCETSELRVFMYRRHLSILYPKNIHDIKYSDIMWMKLSHQILETIFI